MRQHSSTINTGQSPRIVPPRGRLPYGIGVFAALLAIVLALVIGGLLVADRAIMRGFTAELDRDAEATALSLERWVVERLGSLTDFRGLFAESSAPPEATMRLVAGTLLDERPTLARVSLEDPDGSVLFDTTAESSTETDQPPIVLRQPLEIDGEVRAFAVGEFRRVGLRRRIEEAAPPSRRQVTLLAAGDTILHWESQVEKFPGPFAPLASMRRRSISTPSGEVWDLQVAHADNTNNLRAGLWAIGLLAVGFLVAGLVRERRDAARVDERSRELERLSAELLRANRMKSEFLANVSHELRTPLNALVGFVDLLRDGVYGELSPRQAQPVERIAASASHLRHLVDQVLDIAKLAAGRLEVHPEPIALRPFVLDVAAELEPLMSEKGLTLSVSVGSTLPRVRTDPSHLRQVLVNLIGNAVKFTPSGGISIRAREWIPGEDPPEGDTPLRQVPAADRRWVALLVSDTGIGIAPADQARIFDEFEQANPGPRGDSAQRGTGLGLPISRRLARLLGGDITVDSDLGRGATFTLWLAVDQAAVSASARPSPEAASTDSQTPAQT